MARKRSLAGLVSLAALGAAGIGAAAWFVAVAPYRGARFTPAAWAEVWRCPGLSAADCEMQRAACPRGPMLGDLHEWLRPGASSLASVTALLGPGLAAGDGCVQWPLGICAPFSVDWSLLTACFDPTGRLIDLTR